MDMTRYPPAPWQLRGSSIQTLLMVPIDRVRETVPRSLRIVSVLPQRTLAALYCASYASGSTLSYHELIVASALVRAHGKVGFWISQIHVDDPTSQAGGIEIWGLPKKLAHFDWNPQRGVAEVTRDNAVIARLEWQPAKGSLTAPLWLPVQSVDGSRTMHFSARGRCKAAVVQGKASLPAMGGIGFEQSRRFVYASDLKLTVNAPRERRTH